jgi:rhodanese-related sulfurtransferase
MSHPSEPVPIEIDVQQACQLLTSNSDVVLIDVREPSEYEIAKIEGSVLFPMSGIADQLEQLQLYQDKHIIVHCHHGGRSMRVTQWLRQNGFPQAQNMAGGIDAWSIQIDTGIPRY